MKASMKSDRLQYGEEHFKKIQGNLTYFVGALADAEKQMKTSQYKRKLTMLKNKR